MNLPTTSPLPEATTTLCIVLILLTPLSIVGLSLVNTGLTRSRSAAHTMTASLCIFAVAVVTYFVFGFAWQSVAGRPEHTITLAGRPWGWMGVEPFFFRGVKCDGSAVSLVALLQMVSVGLAALIPLGAGADRWRSGAAVASTVLLAGWTYPVFAHWIWGGGWLAQLGANYGLGHGFLDSGGSSAIQVVGGLTALSMAWIIGPRRGKYLADGVPAALPGHNVVLALIGCLLALIGWIGLNSAGALLFSGIESSRVALIAINTILTAAAASLTTAIVTNLRLGKPDASLVANGWIGGLAASSAACAFVPPALTVIIGIVAGILVPFAVELLELRLLVDDPGGAISAHGVAGLWGVLAAGLFANVSTGIAVGASRSNSGNGNAGQLLAQIIGIAALLGFILPVTYGLNWVLNRFYRQRVAMEDEWQGMDLHELGGSAYPEFVTRGDDFVQGPGTR